MLKKKDKKIKKNGHKRKTIDKNAKKWTKTLKKDENVKKCTKT